MKAVLIAFIISQVAILANAHIYEEGEVNCVGANDGGRKYRDINDATAYWVCPQGYDFGVKQRCPSDTAFLESEQKCVVWGAWYWKIPYTK